MGKQEYFLKKHGIVLDKSRSPEEQNQQMKIGFGVKDIETGDKPYIFISYSHKDSAVVFPAIKALQEKRYPVWYDDSIRTGVAWRTHIAERVRDSALVIAFMSENSVASKNCIAEVDHAIDLNLPILTVRLDRSPIPPGLGMYLNRDQMFQAYLYDGDAYITRLAAEPIVAETAGAALEAYNAEKRRAAEEAERKRREAEEAEQTRLKKVALDRRLREAEALLRHVEAEKAEFERLSEELERKNGVALEAEEKFQETLTELEIERKRRSEAERKIQELELKCKALASDEIEKAREALALRFDAAVQTLYTDQYAGYESVMERWNKEAEDLIRDYQALKQDVDRYTDGIYRMAYREAWTLEKAGKNRKARDIYCWLPDDYLNSLDRFCATDVKIDLGGYAWISCMAIGFLWLHFFLLRNVYTNEMSLWLKSLIYMAPMFAVVNFGSIAASKVIDDFIVSARCTGFAYTCFALCLISCLIIDPILLAEVPVFKRILTSSALNLGSALVTGAAYAWLDSECLV